METRKSIVIFGGSFNPPLNSHFAIAQQVLNQYQKVEKVIFIPVNATYKKEGLIENEHRFNMLNKVAEKNSKFIVSDIDMHRYSSLYTIETAEEIQKQFQDKDVWILIGSDNLKQIHKWKKAEELVSKYKILVMERSQDVMEDIIKENKLLNKYQTNFKKVSQEIKNNFNSTYIREQIKDGKSIRYLVPDEIYKYIEENKLYRR